MAPRPRVAVAWPLPPTYQQIWAPLQCLTLVGMSNHCRNLGISNGAKLVAILQSKCNIFFEGLEIDSFCRSCWEFWVRMFVLPFSSVHLSPVSFLRRNAKAVFSRFFATAVIPSPLPGPYVHEQVQGLLQFPGPLASTPSHRPCAQVRFACILPPATPSIA